MLGVKVLHPCRAAAPRQLIHRSVSFPQSNHMIPVAQGRKYFAKAPNAALIQRLVRRAALPPEFFESQGVESTRSHSHTRLPPGVNHFQQIAALRAADIGGVACAHSSAPNAAQL